MDYHRLRWASRRGMLELDLILGPFLEKVYPSLEKEDQFLYHSLLECEDQDLFNWFLNKTQPLDAGHARIVQIVLDNTGLKLNQEDKATTDQS